MTTGRLELLVSLLHPEVHWSGCHNKAQALDWYRSFQAEGTVATVNSVEVVGNAVMLGLSVFRRARRRMVGTTTGALPGLHHRRQRGCRHPRVPGQDQRPSSVLREPSQHRAEKLTLDHEQVISEVVASGAEEENIRLVVVVGSVGQSDAEVEEMSDLDVQLYVHRSRAAPRRLRETAG